MNDAELVAGCLLTPVGVECYTSTYGTLETVNIAGVDYYVPNDIRHSKSLVVIFVRFVAQYAEVISYRGISYVNLELFKHESGCTACIEHPT